MVHCAILMVEAMLLQSVLSVWQFWPCQDGSFEVWLEDHWVQLHLQGRFGVIFVSDCVQSEWWNLTEENYINLDLNQHEKQHSCSMSIFTCPWMFCSLKRSSNTLRRATGFRLCKVHLFSLIPSECGKEVSRGGEKLPTEFCATIVLENAQIQCK